MFSPRLRPPKGHERSYDPCKMIRIYFVQSLIDECKYKLLNRFHKFKVVMKILFRKTECHAKKIDYA